jgi:hypothetical protein
MDQIDAVRQNPDNYRVQRMQRSPEHYELVTHIPRPRAGRPNSATANASRLL